MNLHCKSSGVRYKDPDMKVPKPDPVPKKSKEAEKVEKKPVK